jgi:hypothetical protein
LEAYLGADLLVFTLGVGFSDDTINIFAFLDSFVSCFFNHDGDNLRFDYLDIFLADDVLANGFIIIIRSLLTFLNFLENLNNGKMIVFITIIVGFAYNNIFTFSTHITNLDFIRFLDSFIGYDGFVFGDITADSFVVSGGDIGDLGDGSVFGDIIRDLNGTTFLNQPTSGGIATSSYLLLASNVIRFFEHSTNLTGFGFVNGD